MQPNNVIKTTRKQTLIPRVFCHFCREKTANSLVSKMQKNLGTKVQENTPKHKQIIR